MISDFISQLLASFVQITSFRVGDFSLADFALNTQTSFLNSDLAHLIKIIALIATAALGVSAIILGIKQRAFLQKTAVAPAAPQLAEAGPLQDQWNDILRHIESVREGEWKFAVIEADKITDEVLKNYFPGDTMGERLMNIDKTKLLTIDDLWEAHKIRNRLAHDTNYFLRHAEAMRAIRLFESTLKELGAIL